MGVVSRHFDWAIHHDQTLFSEAWHHGYMEIIPIYGRTIQVSELLHFFQIIIH